MATSFITKNNVFGFWIHDSLFQVVCRCIHDMILCTSIDKRDSWIAGLLQSLDNNARGYFHSYMHLNLEELLVDENDKKKLYDIFESTKKYISEKGAFISLIQLKNWYQNEEIDYEWVSDLETSRLIKIIEYLQRLIMNNITTRANDEIDYAF